MTKQQIIQQIYTDNMYNNIISKFINKDQYDEFKQFIFEQLLAIPDEKIIVLWSNNQFLYYFCGILQNQIKSKTSKWHKEYRSLKSFELNQTDGVQPYSTQIELNEEELEKNFKLKLIEQAIHHHIQRDPKLKTEFDLFNMYHKENMTFREIAKLTRIPLTSVYQYIKNAEILIKNNITQKQNKLRK